MIFFYISVGASNNTIFAPIDVHGLINVHNQILVLKMLKFSEKCQPLINTHLKLL